jgi:hypothetical protein
MPDTQTEIALFERSEVPDGVRMAVAAADIRFQSTTVSPEFLDNVRRLGVLEPVLLRQAEITRSAPYRIIDGHRRVAAMGIIDEMRPIPAIVYPFDISMRQIGAIALSANMHRAPNAMAEFAAIRELMETGATIPQIASSLGIPEHVIIARLRVGSLDERLRNLLIEGRMSASLAQRLGAETIQTQQRIWHDFMTEQDQTQVPLRLTARMAYPEHPQDEQIRLLPQTDIPDMQPTDILAALTDTQRTEFTRAFLQTMQPHHLAQMMTDIPTQTRREIFSFVFRNTPHSNEWLDLASSTFSYPTLAHFINDRVNIDGVVPLINALLPGVQQQLASHYTRVTSERHNAERAANVTRIAELETEIERQRERYRTLERMSASRGGPAPTSTMRPIVEAPGRAYRETLQGPSDDPGEGAESRDVNADALAAAQFDYPVVEESWELVVDHLTDAADSMPLSPSDDCDRFHHDIEALRVRAIQQQRLEDVNAGVVSGRVIPPPAPEPAPANAGRVRRTHAQRAVDHVNTPPTTGAPRSLSEHAALLEEQAAQINANTTRRAGRASPAEAERLHRIRVEREQRERDATERILAGRQHLNRPPRPQQNVLESTRTLQDRVDEASGRAVAETAEELRRNIERNIANQPPTRRRGRSI